MAAESPPREMLRSKVWQPQNVVELVARRMSPVEQQRWLGLLARAPLVARHTSRADPTLMAFGAGLCAFAFILSFNPAFTSAWLAEAARPLAVGAWALCLALGVDEWRAERSVFPSGRFLFDWGYVEVDRDTIHAIPRSELTYEIRGRWLGLGRIRLGLRATGWSTSLAISADEAERVAIAWEDETDASLTPASGYREPASLPLPRGGSPSRTWITPRSRPFVWAAACAALAAGLLPYATTDVVAQVVPSIPRVPDAAAAPIESEYAPSFAQVLAPREGEAAPAVSIGLESCTYDQMRLDTVTSYLELALDRRRVGPLDLGAIPSFAPASHAPARVWARCAWSVDRASGLFDHVDARWGVSRDGSVVVEHAARIDASAVTTTVGACLGGNVSPRSIAGISLILATAVIRRDLYGQHTIGASDLHDHPACVLDGVSTIPVAIRRSPP